MAQGVFTNTWFSILDSSRRYDTTFVLTDSGCVLENDDCEYLENKAKNTHFGFNVSTNKTKSKMTKN